MKHTHRQTLCRPFEAAENDVIETIVHSYQTKINLFKAVGTKTKLIILICMILILWISVQCLVTSFFKQSNDNSPSLRDVYNFKQITINSPTTREIVLVHLMTLLGFHLDNVPNPSTVDFSWAHEKGRLLSPQNPILLYLVPMLSFLRNSSVLIHMNHQEISSIPSRNKASSNQAYLPCSYIVFNSLGTISLREAY